MDSANKIPIKISDSELFSLNTSLSGRFSYLRTKILLDPSNINDINELISIYRSKKEYSQCAKFIDDIIKLNQHPEVSTNMIKSVFEFLRTETDNYIMLDHPEADSFLKILLNINKNEKISLLTTISQLFDGYEGYILKHWLIINSDHYVQTMALKLASNLISTKMPYDENDSTSSFVYEKLLPNIFIRYLNLLDTPSNSLTSLLKDFFTIQNEILIIKFNNILLKDEVIRIHSTAYENYLDTIESIFVATSKILTQRKLGDFLSKFPHFRRNNDIAFSNIKTYLKGLLSVNINISFLHYLTIRHAFTYMQKFGLSNDAIRKEFILFLTLPSVNPKFKDNNNKFKFSCNYKGPSIFECEKYSSVFIQLLWVESLVETIFGGSQVSKSFLDLISSSPQVKEFISFMCIQSSIITGSTPCTQLSTISNDSQIMFYINLIKCVKNNDICLIADVIKSSMQILSLQKSYSTRNSIHQLSDLLVVLDSSTKTLTSDIVLTCPSTPSSLVLYAIHFLIAYISQLDNALFITEIHSPFLIILSQFQWPSYSFLLDQSLHSITQMQNIPLKSFIDYLIIDDVIEKVFKVICEHWVNVDMNDGSYTKISIQQRFIQLMTNDRIFDNVVIQYVFHHIDKLIK